MSGRYCKWERLGETKIMRIPKICEKLVDNYVTKLNIYYAQHGTLPEPGKYAKVKPSVATKVHIVSDDVYGSNQYKVGYQRDLFSDGTAQKKFILISLNGKNNDVVDLDELCDRYYVVSY